MSDPTILAFDTSGSYCAAALLMDGKIVASRQEEMKKGQAERLMPMLDEVLVEVGADWADLNAIGVSTGPGNFTGIRIAVSAARGFALSLGIPAIGVSNFEAQHSGSENEEVLIPAPRGQVYASVYSNHSWSDPILRPGECSSMVVNPSNRIAEMAAKKFMDGSELAKPTPLYVRPADAAPSSDPPPVILP